MPAAPAEKKLAEELSPAFGKAAFRVDRSRPLTFVCGGNDCNGTLALRNQFLAHATQAPRAILPVLAERAFPHQLIERNLQLFERFLATTAECVLIFVESAGSFAETGLFAGSRKIRKKTFVINTREESRQVSFLNLGPIKLIRRHSLFDTVYDLDGRSVTSEDARSIVDSILRTVPKYKNALVFHPENKFSDLALRLQLACVHMAVTLMRGGTAKLVISLLREHFDAVEAEKIERFLALLTAINLLQRYDEIYFNPQSEAFKDDALVLSTDFSVENMMMRTLAWQIEHNSQVATFWREQRGIDI